MDAATSSFNLGTVLLASIVLFPLACLFFGTRGGYYNTDQYDGNGTALSLIHISEPTRPY